MSFSKEYTELFSRHIRLPEFGKEGQEKISKSKILLVGAGGLGSPAMTYLAGAGVKKLGVADSDIVELSNLPRQIVHNHCNIGQDKVSSAGEKLKEINPDIELELINKRIKSDNISKIVSGYDIIIDGADNFQTKYLLNDTCVISNKPLIHGGVLRYTGQIMTIIPHKSACLRCVFPELPPVGTVPTCKEAGILSTVAGIGGLIQATEAIKLIARLGKPLLNRLFVFDLLTMNLRIVHLKMNPDCPVCGKNSRITKLSDIKIPECHS